MRGIDVFSLEWRKWINDPAIGTEVFVVDRDTFLSYRAPGRKFADPAEQAHFEKLCRWTGLSPGREETGIVRRHGSTLVLVGDHRRAMENLSAAGLALYYDASEDKCPGSDDSWWERMPS